MDRFWKCSSCIGSASVVEESRDKREKVLEVYGLIDPALAKLSLVEKLPLISENDSPWAVQMVYKIHSCKLGLRFFRMFLMSLFTLEDISVPANHICEAIQGICDFISCPRFAVENHNFEVELVLISRNNWLDYAQLEFGNWIADLLDKIQGCYLKLEKSCELLLDGSLRCNSLMNKMTLDFFDAILENTKAIWRYLTSEQTVLFKNQVETFEKKLTLLRNLFYQTPKEWSGFRELQEFKDYVHVFAQYSASLVFLHWIRVSNVELATKRNRMLLNMINPCNPVFKAFYIRFLGEMRQLDSLLLGQIVQIFLSLLLENLMDILKDDFQILEEGLMFVIAFLANPPGQLLEDEEMITAEIEEIVKEDLYLLLSVHGMKGEGKFSEATTCLSEVERKLQLVKGKVQQVYKRIQDSFSYDFPKINGLGFFDFLLQNLGYLKEKLKSDTNFIPFAKHLIIKIEMELMSTRPYLNYLFEQQKDQQELKDIWLKVINLAYQTESAINLSSVISHPLWYHMARLMVILDEIKVVNSKLNNIEGRKTHDDEVIHYSVVVQNKAREDLWASGSIEVMVGLEKELDIIVEKLVHGTKFLDLVAIVGMPGLGKTTLANKVYNTPMIRHYFHKFAYCIVSQVHNAKKILIDILDDVNGKDENMYDMLEENLADMLRKCLKGKRYLIIMDDIWNVKAWDEIKRSLPNDQNGSRVIFTTRIRNVALQAKEDCIIHDLRFLSEKESWELLRNKALGGKSCPPAFSEVGKMIAKNCKGLPLTIVLIAGLLAKTEISLSWWNKISEAIGSYVSTEGCMDVIELSYQHLPEHLKPCFLYFGAFVEDKLIRANKLTLLWIAEGFVLNSNKENLKKKSKEYLSDLVDRSLVIVNERSSYGGIKSCTIHDLVHEFCQRKAQEEDFFQYMDGCESFNSSSSMVSHAYRVCCHAKGFYFNDSTETYPNIHSLLGSRRHGTHLYRHFGNFSKLKIVQVMDLEELMWNTCLINEISSWVHLRFLAASFPSEIPTRDISSIFNLWNLEILIFTRSIQFGELELPETIWNMTRLRHIDVGRCYLSSLGVKKHEAYPQMVNLESFSSPYISSIKDLEDILQMSPSLKKLSFCPKNMEHPRDDFHFPKSLSKLESLKVFNVGRPCLCPFNFLSTLKKLSLSHCYLPWRYMPAITKMPCLEVLKLLDNAFYGLEWDMEDTKFRKLKFLKLQGLDLTKWIAYGESFPSLEVLIVNSCYCLKLPLCFGETQTLKRIEVYVSYKAATSVVEIEETQKDLGNEELQVVVSSIALRR